MAWISLSSVSVANGDITVSVTCSVDLSGVLSGWALIINNNYVEIKSGTSADSGGNSTLTLAGAWDGSTITNQPAKIMPTSAPQLEIAQLMTDTNEYAIDVHNTLTEIATEDKDVTIADNTGTEHTFASMPKNARLVKEAIQSGSDELASITADIKSQLEKQAMSKTVFFALAEQRKRDSAGSGFLEMGKHFKDYHINNGLSSAPNNTQAYSNTLSLGDPFYTDELVGESRTKFAQVVVNGVQHKLQQMQSIGYKILFPEAERGTRSYDSETGEVIDYLTDIDPKYGDVAADLNEAVARNFEGLVKNSDFRFGTDDWLIQSGAEVSVTDGVIAVTDAGNSNSSQVATPSFNGEFSAGTNLIISGQFRSPNGTFGANVLWEAGGASTNISALTSSTEWEDFTIDWTQVEGEEDLKWGLKLRESGNTGTRETAQFRNISIRKKTNQPILSRQDYCFLETWHEKVSDKDVFCPLGNVQYGSGTSDEGVTLVKATTLGVGQGYSAFGEWDTSREGYVAKWSELTTAEQRACLDNPDNNLYFDNEADKLIQVRYRIRVVKGIGNDYKIPLPQQAQGPSVRLQRDSGFTGVGTLVTAQGLKDTSYDANSSNFVFFTDLNGDTTVGEQNLWKVADSLTQTSVDALCFALPICLVQRGNQGAYHPVYNPDGFRAINHSNDVNRSNLPWYDTNAYKATSTAKCFETGGAGSFSNDLSGYLSGGYSGRLDQYDYYDVIYAGQVQDLRLNANKQDPNRLMEDAIRKAVSGETRGKGKQVFSTVYDDAGSGSDSNAARKWYIATNAACIVYTETSVNLGDSFYVYDASLGLILRGLVGTLIEEGYFAAWKGEWEVLLGDTPAYPDTGEGNEVYYIIEKELSTEYNSLPWVDIVGSPANIMATFPDGCVGQWVPEISNSVLDKFSLNKKSVATAGLAIRTGDNGESWTAYGAGIDTTLNTWAATNNPSTNVGLVYYEALSDFTEPDDNTAVYGEIGDVVAGGHYQIPTGNRLQASLTDSISTTNSSSFAAKYLKSTSSYINHFFMELAGTSNKHTPVSFDGAYSGLSAFKALYHLIEKDGLLYMQYHGRELQHNGTDWGDDSTVPIVDNESTMVDDNGNTVKTFTHTEIFPIGIADYTQTN